MKQYQCRCHLERTRSLFLHRYELQVPLTHNTHHRIRDVTLKREFYNCILVLLESQGSLITQTPVLWGWITVYVHLPGFLPLKTTCRVWVSNNSLAEIEEESFKDEHRARAAENGQRLTGQQAEHGSRQGRPHETFQHSLQRKRKGKTGFQREHIHVGGTDGDQR